MKFKNIRNISYIYIVISMIFLWLGTPALAKPPQEAFDRSIVILAPTSMTEALNAITRKYSSINNISTSVNFDSASELADQIEQGEAANIFITDNQSRMLDMQRLGLLNVFSLMSVASDELVIVTPKNSYLKRKLENKTSVEDKLHFLVKNTSLVIPDPDSEIAGKATIQALSKINEWSNAKAKMLRATNTRNALYLVANGNNAGIVYKSDALSDPTVEILFEIPQDYYDKIIYQASIVAELGNTNTNDTQKFMNYLKSDEVKKIFAHFGFSLI